MRSQFSLCVVALALACALPAFGEEAQFEVSAFVEPGASYSDYHGFDLDTGLGAGLGWRFAPHWTAEARLLRFDAEFADAENYELGLRYAFGEADARWRPFVVGGIHHQQSDLRYEVVCVTGPCPDREESYDDTGLFAGGGVDWQLSDWFALRFEGRLAVYDSELTDDLEEELDLTAGVVFRF
jgi:opacity protein-like surface antigen